jgi:hypothetical protein
VKQAYENVEAEIAAQIFVNGSKVDYIEGRQRGKQVTILWTDQDGVRWEGDIVGRSLKVPDELVAEVAEIRFIVPRPILVSRRRTDG